MEKNSNEFTEEFDSSEFWRMHEELMALKHQTEKYKQKERESLKKLVPRIVKAYKEVTGQELPEGIEQELYESMLKELKL